MSSAGTKYSTLDETLAEFNALERTIDYLKTLPVDLAVIAVVKLAVAMEN